MRAAVITSREGETLGLDYRTGAPLHLRWKQGKVIECEPADCTAEVKQWIAPGLIDAQVNGYASVDFQCDGLSQTQLSRAAEMLRQAGCARFLVTLITDAWPRLLARLEHLRSLRDRSDLLQQCIAGWHIEGPFLSNAPGYHGTHDPALTRDPQPRDIEELRAASGDDLVLLTLDPTRSGAIEAIRCCARAGIRVSLGHTNASADVLGAAIEAGAQAFTHLGNGCAAEINRHDNILWRVIDLPPASLFVSLIPDRVHVPPPLFRMFHKALPADRVFYVTDCMAAADAPPGRYSLGQLQLEVGVDGVVRRPGSPYLSGSALTPLQGVERAASMLRESWRTTWKRFSEIPAQMLGLDVQLRVDAEVSNFCLVHA